MKKMKKKIAAAAFESSCKKHVERKTPFSPQKDLKEKPMKRKAGVTESTKQLRAKKRKLGIE